MNDQVTLTFVSESSKGFQRSGIEIVATQIDNSDWRRISERSGDCRFLPHKQIKDRAEDESEAINAGDDLYCGFKPEDEKDEPPDFAGSDRLQQVSEV